VGGGGGGGARLGTRTLPVGRGAEGLTAKDTQTTKLGREGLTSCGPGKVQRGTRSSSKSGVKMGTNGCRWSLLRESEFNIGGRELRG